MELVVTFTLILLLFVLLASGTWIGLSLVGVAWNCLPPALWGMRWLSLSGVRRQAGR